MKIEIGKREGAEEREANSITIILDYDVHFEISQNNFGELVLTKQNYGKGESSIQIKPSVSNEIRIN